MIHVKFENNSNRISIVLKCMIGNLEHELRVIRPFDETLDKTLDRIHRHYSKKLQIYLKTLKKNSPTSKIDKTISSSFKLLDLDNNIVDLNLKNKDAWKDGYNFKIESSLLNEIFKVVVNLPAIVNLHLSESMIAGLPIVAKLEVDDVEYDSNKINLYSKMSWLSTKTKIDQNKFNEWKKIKLKKPHFTPPDESYFNSLEWEVLSEGTNKKYLILNDESEGKLIKCICIPNDGTGRDGIPFEKVASCLVEPKLDLNNFPMTRRHNLTKDKMDKNE
jgi:hypothetical protein